MASVSNNKIDAKYIGVSALAVILSWCLHEFSHWAVGKALGYKMALGLNQVYPVNGSYLGDADYHWVSAAGPLFTLTQALVIFILMKQKRRFLLYPFLFTCFYMRLFATIISFLNPNDEARISHAIGIGTFTLPVITTAFLFFLIYKATRLYGFRMPFQLKNLGLTILFSSIIILADQYLHIRLL